MRTLRSERRNAWRLLLNAGLLLNTALLLATLFAATMGSTAYASGGVDGVRQSGEISVPGSNPQPPIPWFTDDGWVNPATHLFYQSDITNARIDILNLATRAYIGNIPGFVGVVDPSLKQVGPEHIQPIGSDLGLVSDAHGLVQVVNFSRRKIVASIKTGGVNRTDAIALDPARHLAVVSSPQDSPPFVTFIDTQTLKIKKQVPITRTTASIDDVLWDSVSQTFLLAIDASVQNPNGEIDRIDPSTMSLAPHPYGLALPCTPGGLAFGPDRTLAIGCATASPLIFSLRTGTIQAQVAGISGIDFTAYLRGHFFFAAFSPTAPGVLGVSDLTGHLLQTIPTPVLSHVVIADPGDGVVIVPENGIGVVLFSLAP